MDIAKSIEQRIGLKKRAGSGKASENIKIDTSEMNEQEKKQCITDIWNEIIKKDQ
jgi:hypothetical protein